MPVNLPNAIDGLLYLTPGLVAVLIVRLLSRGHRKLDPVTTTIYALVYTLIARVIYEMMAANDPKFAALPQLRTLTLLSCVLGLIVGGLNHYRILQRAAALLRLSSSLTPAGWAAAFEWHPDKWVLIELKDGRSLRAWPVSSPIEPKDEFIVLNHVLWLERDDATGEEKKSYEAANTRRGTMLIPISEIHSIELLEPLEG